MVAASSSKFACPSCQQHLNAPSELYGKSIECPSCQGAIVVPFPEAEAPSPAKTTRLGDPAASDPSGQPKSGAQLWNPVHAALLSLVSLGLAGPVAHALNWKTLGESGFQKRSLNWAAGFIGLDLFLFASNGALGVYGWLVLLVLICVWYARLGHQQVAYLRGRLPAQTTRSSKPLVLTSALALIVALAIGAPDESRPDGGGKGWSWNGKSEDLSARARRATETLVRNNLKSPSSAQFSKFEVLDSSGPFFQTMITVDSQNGFGAMIRSDAVTVFKLEEDGKFRYNQFDPVLFIEPNNFLKRGEFNMLQEEIIQSQKRRIKWPGITGK